jgi:hypothetical protein
VAIHVSEKLNGTMIKWLNKESIGLWNRPLRFLHGVKWSLNKRKPARISNSIQHIQSITEGKETRLCSITRKEINKKQNPSIPFQALKIR